MLAPDVVDGVLKLPFADREELANRLLESLRAETACDERELELIDLEDVIEVEDELTPTRVRPRRTWAREDVTEEARSARGGTGGTR